VPSTMGYVRTGDDRGATAAAARFDLFISYSHRADRHLARALKSAVQQFGKAFYRLRARAVYLDQTNLESSPELWPVIEKALERSRYFLVLCSPDSARSPWVQREIEYWRAHKDASHVLIGLTDGELLWDVDGRDFDWETTTAVPRALAGVSRDEPFWLDLRAIAALKKDVSASLPQLRDAVAPLVARIDGQDLDLLVSEDARQHRRFRRTAMAVGAGLVVLSLAAASLAVSFLSQRNEALRRLVRIDVANGMQRLDLQDYPGAAVWFGEALTLTRDHRDEAALRMRLFLSQYPRVDQTFFGSAPVVSAVYSRDGSRVAVACANRTARVWDAESGAPVGGELSHKGPASSVALSPDGRYVALGALDPDDPSVHPDPMIPEWPPPQRDAFTIHDAKSGRPLARTIQDDFVTTGVQYSRDGGTLLLTGDGARAWKVGPHHALTPAGKAGYNTFLVAALSPDGSRYALALFGHWVVVVDAATGQKLFEIDASPFKSNSSFVISRVVFSADGARLASGDKYGNVRVWDAKSGAAVTDFLKLPREISALAFSPAGRLLFASSGSFESGMERGTFIVWQVKSGQRATYEQHVKFPIVAAAFSPDGTRIATAIRESGSGRRETLIFAAPPDEPVVPVMTLPRVVLPMVNVEFTQWHPDGRRILAIGPDDVARTWRIDGNPLATPLPNGTSFDDNISVVPRDGIVQVLGGDGRPAGPPIEVQNDITFAASGDRKLLAVGMGQRFEPSVEPKVVVFSIATGKPIGPPMPQKEFPDLLELSPDGRWVSVLWHKYNPERGMVRVWDARTSEPAGPLLTHRPALNSAHFDPGGKKLITASSRGAVIIWDPFTGRELGPRIEQAVVADALFSPDSRTILTRGGRQGVEALRLWDAQSGRPLTTAMSHPGADHAAFSADGRFIVSSGGGTVRLWLAATGDLLSPPIAGLAPRWHSHAARLLINPGSHPLVLDLDRDSGDAAALLLTAQAVAARHVDATGTLTELDGPSLREICRKAAAAR
jgi:WD40 repeat protein